MRQKAVLKLAEEGYGCLREHDYNAALDIAAKLEEARYSAAFEIAALAYSGLNKKEEAVAVLQRGVTVAPDCWLNWELLGNYLSDLERYDAALTAYERAFDCTDSWKPCVLLNMAILEGRRGNHEEALRKLEQVTDPQLALEADAARVRELEDLRRYEEAAELASNALNKPYSEEDDRRPLARIAAGLARIHLLQGRPKSEIASLVRNALHHYDKVSPDLLAVLRRIDNKRSPDARMFKLVVHFSLAGKNRGAAGYLCTFWVIAETSEEALGIVKNHERELDFEHATIEEVEDVMSTPDEPLGIYDRTGRCFYEEP